MSRPNVVFVFADQWRAQATGYAGDGNVRTPNLDRLAADGVNVTQALSGCPVCSPYRASLMTGQFPLTHGVFVNDVLLPHRAPSLADAFSEAGYATAYIGKWHIDGHGRSNYIPPERRQGFEYWKVLECTHDYNRSAYYAGRSAQKLFWPGYDAIAQTRDAQAYIRNRDRAAPFLLCLSWGGPHAPYQTAPPEFRALYEPGAVQLRPNVPAGMTDAARRDLAGYYAHCSALDHCVGRLRATLREEGLEDNTLFVFTSDHGDMLGSQGAAKKQQPWEESIRVPLLLFGPSVLGSAPRAVRARIDAPDILPTLLGLCGIAIPDTVEGIDYAECLRGGPDPSDGAALLMCPHPFGQWAQKRGGREYRGLRTERHTYVRDLNGPWLLFDNEADPYQQHNLRDDPAHLDLRAALDARLDAKLRRLNDEFLPGDAYIRRWGYRVAADGTVPYTN
ncbi:MAG: sulfatase [Kiritimatiellae bacterium]|nr:sulfatase [Kiritimatiellia bacterium]